MLLRATTTILSLTLLTNLCAAAAPSTTPALADAAEKADWSSVQSILKGYTEASIPQVDGTTALHWAAFHDNLDIAKLLITANANAKAENRYGVTPLSLACTNGDAEMIRILLAASADPNVALHGDETPLMTASRTGRVDAVQVLLNAGAKIDAKDRKGQSALMWAAADGQAAVVECLIKAGADPHERLKSGFTPMLFAAREGRIEVVRSLLKAGVDANEAIQTSQRGAATAPKNGLSALLLAIENGHFELAAELVKAGADPNDERSGFTPLHAMTWVRKPDRGDGADGAPPPNGSGNLTSVQFVRFLVEHGAKVNTRLQRGSSGKAQLSLGGATPFLMASKTADLQYMKLLIELGADPTIANKDGCTPLMAAAGIGVLAADEVAGTEPEACAAVEYLVSIGADVNAVDQNGETAMHGAAYKNLPKMVQTLADKGAKIEVWNKKDRYGWTPLLIAQGFRPGNFKPSIETAEAIEKVMRAAGVTPPPAPARSVSSPTGYDDPNAGQ